MLVSSKESQKDSQKGRNSPENDYRPETVKKIFSITNFRNEQIKHLCRVGVAPNISEFMRLAIVDLIRKNQHLLKGSLVPANWKEPKKERKSSKKTRGE